MTDEYPNWILLSKPEIELLESLPKRFGPAPVRVLNLGDMQGGSAIIFALAGADVATVDCYSESKMARSQANATEYGVRERIEYIRLTTDEAFERMRRFGTVPFDIIFVDADHSYEGVKKDALNSLDFLKPEGLIAFHDCDQFQIQRALDGVFKHRPYRRVEEVDRIRVYQQKNFSAGSLRVGEPSC